MRMLIAYAWVSTDDPHLELQRAELVEAECERVFESGASSVKSERTGLIELVVARMISVLIPECKK